MPFKQELKLNKSQPNPVLLNLLKAHGNCVLLHARVDHAEILLQGERAEEFPIDKLQNAFLERVKTNLPAGTRIVSLAFAEFAWILDETQAYETICAQIIDHFRDPFDYDTRTAYVTLSIATAEVTPSSDPAALLRLLEHSLRSAQLNGGNRWYSAHDFEILNQIPAAIEREEFAIYFQALWTTNDQHLVGAEALLRWHGMDVNQIEPSQLVRIAESGGRMSSLGNWIINKACSHATSWLEQLVSPLTLGLNISSQQFRSPIFINTLTKCLEENWLSASMLELEIKYTDFKHLLEQHSQSLLTLSNMGIHLCLDNIDNDFFNPEYQSLREAILRRKPFVSDTSAGLVISVSSVKFDPQTVIQLFGSSVDKPMKASIQQFVSDCSSEKIRTVAVGVETEAILTGISSLGFEYAQGYLLSQPMNAEQFRQLVSTTRR